MAERLIQTEFDGILEEDVILEEVDTLQSTQDILKNAENVYKANLYLKELFTSAPVFNEVISFSTYEETDKTLIPVDADTNLLTIKNLKDDESEIYLDDGTLVLLPFESFEFPPPQNKDIYFKGRVSVIQTKYQ